MNLKMTSLCLLFLALAAARLGAGTADGSAADFAALVADRTAIEHVYYVHREGNKPSFEQALPRRLVEDLVNRNLEREHALKQMGIEFGAPDIEAEARRIDRASKAPDVLAELKKALDNDPVRFGRSVVKPILVERRLEQLYHEDLASQSVLRRQAEQLHKQLLATRPGEAEPGRLRELVPVGATVTETTWRLDAPLGKPNGAAPAKASAASEDYRADATAQWAVNGTSEKAASLSELRPELQALLRAQLQRPGDVSAVVETDVDFVVFVARDKTEQLLRTAAVHLPKETYESWLAQHTRRGASHIASQ